MREGERVIVDAIGWMAEHGDSVREAKWKANPTLVLLNEGIRRQNGYPPEVTEDMFRGALFELGYCLGRTYQDVPEVYKAW